ncbi:hypothetical protein ACIRBX_34365 [Kitasatospora sp. NPDC096147]|uniref:hypothetical protein n=1 Tax=Kitasatospora sp. NPDC096147 TaxID=3364093 RepID=UPI003823367D
MRPWHTLGAVCGALAVTAVLSTPAPATPSAPAASGAAEAVQVATGTFSYRYAAPDGRVLTRTMQDPTAGVCITIEEAADPDTSAPAFGPQNGTDWWTLVYDDAVCAGDTRTLRPHGGATADRLKLRAVKFLYR